MPCAVAATTWIQLAGTFVAMAAAVASWVAVVQARRSAEDAREAEREAMLPVLLIAINFLRPGAGHPTMGVSVYNAGGGIARNVAILLATDDAYGRHVVTFLRPGETVAFGSDIDATDSTRAVVYARSADRRDFVWNTEDHRRELAGGASPMPSWDVIFGAFYDDASDLQSLRPGQLLSSENRLY